MHIERLYALNMIEMLTSVHHKKKLHIKSFLVYMWSLRYVAHTRTSLMKINFDIQECAIYYGVQMYTFLFAFFCDEILML
jgi:hypothetical protein